MTVPNSTRHKKSHQLLENPKSDHHHGGLPSIVTDDTQYRLYDLINSDFRMAVTDKDFELSHE